MDDLVAVVFSDDDRDRRPFLRSGDGCSSFLLGDTRPLPGTAVQDDRLGLGHLRDGGARAFLTDAAALQPAVGNKGGPPQRSPVDMDVPGVDLPDGTYRAADVAGEYACSQAVGG